MPCQLPGSFQLTNSWNMLPYFECNGISYGYPFVWTVAFIQYNPGMIAAAHDDLQPPLPLLSLSSSYLTRTKGSVMPPPIFFLALPISKWCRGPMSNPYTGFMPLSSKWIASTHWCMQQGVIDTYDCLANACTDFFFSFSVTHAGWLGTLLF